MAVRRELENLVENFFSHEREGGHERCSSNFFAGSEGESEADESESESGSASECEDLFFRCNI